MIRESDFWQPGTRAIMLSSPAGQLTGGGRMQVWITTSEGALMANFNTIIKRKQYLWLGLILVGGAGAIGECIFLT